MAKKRYDFSGWATKANLKCADGRTILKDAFKDNDGQTVPLVWDHQHGAPDNILGHALLENRAEGVYAYCEFNDSTNGQSAKELVRHGDIVSLSIFANQLKQQGSSVLHGAIREVSLVLAGANPGAFIDSVTMAHGEESEVEAVIFTGEGISISHGVEFEEDEELEHSMKAKPAQKSSPQPDSTGTTKTSTDDETVADVMETLTDKQKTVVYALIGQALQDAGADTAQHSENDNSEGGANTMKHNVFDQKGTETNESTLSHSELTAIVQEAKKNGSMRDAFLAHGIEHIDYLFPDAKALDTQPQFISRDMTWVSKVMTSVHNTPFSRIKSLFADITEDQARAKGYIKGNLKKEEVFSLLKRTTGPTTIYKKQKLDRDDVVDIVDIDVVAWLKAEMRMMLDEEIARALLIGDGRLSSDDDKIKEDCMRPIWKDEALYTVNALVTVADPATATEDAKAKAFIKAAIKSRKLYKGSGNPTLFTTEDVLTDCLLLTDNQGRDLYDSVDKLAIKLRVKEIVTVPVMENQTRTVDSKTRTLMGIIVNLQDYNVGADKGGAVNMFDDFDIDYNAQKYLIETRGSGALTKPFSAIALELVGGTVAG